MSNGNGNKGPIFPFYSPNREDKVLEVTPAIETQDLRHLMDDVVAEYCRAGSPGAFPGTKDNLLALCEEHGELVKAVLDYKQDKADGAEVRKELIQTLSMLLRLWFGGDSALGLPPVKDA